MTDFNSYHQVSCAVNEHLANRGSCNCGLLQAVEQLCNEVIGENHGHNRFASEEFNTKLAYRDELRREQRQRLAEQLGVKE